MDIKIFSESLHQKLKEAGVSAADDLIKIGKGFNSVKEMLMELKQFTNAYSFRDEQEEIMFFKDIKPVLLSQYYYHKKIFELQLFDSFRDLKSRVDNYHGELKRLEKFAKKNQDFYGYCMSGATNFDKQYFTRNNSLPLPLREDQKFSTGYDRKLAKILAHEMIKDHLQSSLQRSQEIDSVQTGKRLQWTSSKVAMIELLYALYASGAIGYGKSDLKQIVNCFETLFSIDLGNYARVFSEIRIRKSGQTNFLDQLRERLSHLIEDSN